MRRRTAGLAQAAIAVGGGAMSVWWLLQVARQWAEDGYFAWDGGAHFAVGLAGVLVFAIAWVWSLGTSLSAVRAAKPAVISQRASLGRTDFLVTGTDTGVGKTVVAAALVLALRESGRRAIGFKPAETGIGPAAVADSAILARASAEDDPLARPLISLAEGLAPAVAAERAGLVVDPREIEARIRALRAGHEVVVVEGAGGVAVPLAGGYTALDLASACALQAVVVARPGLGTLNHIALTVAALRAGGVAVAAIILNGASSAPDLAEATNPAALARMLPGVRCLSLPRQDTTDPWEVAQLLAPRLAELTKV